MSNLYLYVWFDFSYLKCKNTVICQGTAKLVNNELKVLHAHEACCFPDPDAEKKARFKHEIRMALERNWYKLKDLYDLHAEV